MNKIIVVGLIVACLIGQTFAQDEGFDKNSELTHGNVQMHLKVGETSQYEILEVFGAPNITSMDGEGQEVWIYRKHAVISNSKSKSGGFLIGLFGGGGNVGGGVGGGYNKSSTGFDQSSRTMTLIIKFNDENIVSDFKSRSSSF